MRKTAVFSLCTVALSLLVVLPQSHASGGCERVVVDNQTRQNTCPYLGDGHEGSGYGVAITPGSTWKIFHYSNGVEMIDASGYQSSGGIYTFAGGVYYYAEITGSGVIGMGQQ